MLRSHGLGFVFSPPPPFLSHFFCVCVFVVDCTGSSLLCSGFLRLHPEGLLFVAVPGLLAAVASLVEKRRLSSCGSQASLP